MAQAPLNLYGDRTMPSTGAHGVNISSQRIDELDEALLVKADDNKGAICLDLGCGDGTMSHRLAEKGFRVYGYDIQAPASQNSQVTFTQADLRKLNTAHFPRNIRFIYSQRFIHYLTYDQACTLLDALRPCLTDDAEIYISASGLSSELGNGYEGQNLPLEERHAPLAPEMAEKHLILEKVTLYTGEDLSRLVDSAGFKTVKVWASDFGNQKLVGKRT